MNHPGIPRIRGMLGQIESEDADNGKWIFKIELWDVEATELIGPPFGPFGPFDTEEEAAIGLQKASRDCADAITKAITGEKSDEYYDMKKGGILRKWSEKEQ